jgi:hypothetical protein
MIVIQHGSDSYYEMTKLMKNENLAPQCAFRPALKQTNARLIGRTLNINKYNFASNPKYIKFCTEIHAGFLKNVILA